ncbi:hypothetical protein SAMD00079811_32330 [Scytonema sp. HK-05]|nr:hypothetical protein SAMD00079811_32330 [Scytonema sp. HK-05]
MFDGIKLRIRGEIDKEPLQPLIELKALFPSLYVPEHYPLQLQHQHKVQEADISRAKTIRCVSIHRTISLSL